MEDPMVDQREMEKHLRKYLDEVLVETGVSWKYNITLLPALTDEQIKNPIFPKSKPILMYLGSFTAKPTQYGFKVSFEKPSMHEGGIPPFFDIYPIDGYPDPQLFKDSIKCGLELVAPSFKDQD